jgi:hypothetical protein
MLVWLLGFSLRKEAINEKNDTYKKRMKACEGWSLDPYFMTLIALYMNSLTPQ